MLNLGDINFGIDVNTSPLGPAVSRIQNFGSEVEKAAKRVGAGADEAAAALARQEKAALRALQQTLSLQARIERAGGNPALINQSSLAFDKLARSITQTSLSTLGMQRAQEGFQASLGTVTRSLAQLQQQQGPVNERAKLFALLLKDASSMATLTVGPLSGVGARITALSSLFSRQGVILAGAAAGFALVTAGMTSLGIEAVDVAQKLNVVSQRFSAIGAGPQFNSDALVHLHDEARRLGVDFLELSDSYSKFLVTAQSTGMAVGEATKIFDTFATVGAKLHLPQEEMTRVMQTLERMMSTGVVNAMELRRQLAVALPGAVAQTAAAIGVTTEVLTKMARQGDLIAQDILPKMTAQFAKFYNVTGNDKVVSLTASINDFHNSVVDLAAGFDQAFGVSVAYKASLDNMGGAMEVLSTHMVELRNAAAALAVGGLIYAFGPQVPAMIEAITAALVRAKAAMIAFDIATMANPFGALAAVLGRVALAAVAAAGSYAILTEATGGSGDKFAQASKKVQDYVDSLKDSKIQAYQLAEANVNNAREFIKATEQQIDADRRRLAASQDASKSPYLKGDPDAWMLVQQNIGGATSALHMHEAELKTLLTDLPLIVKNYKDLKAAADAISLSDESKQAIEAVKLKTNELMQLKAAAGQGAAAVQMLQDRFRDFSTTTGPMKEVESDLMKYDSALTGPINKLNTLIDKQLLAGKRPTSSLVDEAGITGEANKQLKTFMDNVQAKGELIPRLGENMREYNDIIRNTAQNYKIAAAAVQGPGFAEGLQKSFARFDKADDARQRIERLRVSVANATTVANAYKDSLDADAASETKVAAIDMQRVLDRTNLQAAAMTKYDGAVRSLTEAFSHSDQIRQWTNELASKNFKPEEISRTIDMLSDAMNRLNQASENHAFKEIGDQTRDLAEQISAVHKGGGQDVLDQIRRNQEYTHTVDKLTRELIDEADVTSRVQELMAAGIDPANAWADAMDQVAAKAHDAAVAFAGNQKDLEDLAPAIADNKSLWKDYGKTIDEAAGSVADSFAAMATGSASSMNNLGDTFKRMVEQMIADTIKLQLIKPVFDFMFGDITGAGAVSTGGVTGTQGGAGGGALGGIGGLLQSASGASSLASLLGLTSSSTVAADAGMEGMADMGAGIGGEVAGGSEGFFSSIMSLFAMMAKGGAWDNGTRYAASGMVLGGPTMFGTPSGPVVGGELGYGTEALMPLTRGSDGKLGVKMYGDGPNRANGGGPLVHMVVNTRDAKSFGYSKNQINTNISTGLSVAHARNSRG